MNYADTLAWMFKQLPMYQRVGAVAYKKDLTNTYLLMEVLDMPQHKFKSVHIGGTNGKGSTSHMLASVLQEAGYKVGLYTSPHLVDFRERIRINGAMIPENFVCNFINKNKHFFEKNQLSFFEMTVGLAFQYFADEEVDIAVIEVGMGGRLDSTNVITPLVSAITNISLDHTQFLGETQAKIATEKAGIIKPFIPCIIGEFTSETQPVFIEKAKRVQAPLIFAKQLNEKLPSDLKGSFQLKNQSLLLSIVEELISQNWDISNEHLLKALLQVKENTGLRGRWEILQEFPRVVADTGHNKAGIQAVLNQLEQEKYNKLHVVFGMVNDKSATDILALMPKDANYYICEASIPRSKKAIELHAEALALKLNAMLVPSPVEAFNLAIKNSTKEDLIWVGGSTFIVADILLNFEAHENQ